jgi:hypothetical protein
MAAAITKNIATVRRALDNVAFTVTGLPVNDSTEYDANAYPTERRSSTGSSSTARARRRSTT